MASPSSVLTLGLGSWGSASDLLTLGYGLSEDVPETTTYVVCVSGSSRRVIGVEGAARRVVAVSGASRRVIEVEGFTRGPGCR